MASTWQDFESGNDGDAITGGPGNTGASFVVLTGGTAVISTATPAHGTRSVRMTATASSGGVYMANSGMSATAFARDFVLRVITDVSANVTIWWLGTGSRMMSIELTPTRTLQLKDAAGATLHTTSALPADTSCRVGVYVTQNATTGTALLSWWSTPLDDGTPADTSGTLTGRNTGASAYTDERLGVKCTTNTITGVVDIDLAGSDRAATGLAGPYVPPAPLGDELRLPSETLPRGAADTWDNPAGAIYLQDLVPAVTGGAFDLAGSGASTTSATGTVALTATLAGTAPATSGAAATLTVILNITTTSAATTGSSGSMQGKYILAGTGPASSSGTGTAGLSQPLAATAAAATTGTGSIAGRFTLAGIANATTDGAGTFTAEGLTGTASATTGASGTISGLYPLAGVATATVGSNGTITASLTLAGTGAGTTDAAGTIAGRLSLTGTATATTDSAGTIVLRAAFAGIAASTTGASGDLQLYVELVYTISPERTRRVPSELRTATITETRTLTAPGSRRVRLVPTESRTHRIRRNR